MKKSICLGAGLFVLCSATLAHAQEFLAGDHTQGTYVCGAMLDTLQSGKPTGDCLTVVSKGNPSSTTSTQLTLSDGTHVDLGTCEEGPGKLHWQCERARFSKNQFCGKKSNEPVKVIVLKATLSKGLFTFGSGLTVTCQGRSKQRAEEPCNPPPMENFGTADDCIQWKYGPVGDARLFNACVRMARADYPGDGKSWTRPGTLIQPVAPGGISSGGPDHCDCNDCQGCLEAYWDEQGAICISHRRWEDLKARISGVANLSADDAEKVLKKTFPKPFDTNLDCRPAGDPSKALLRNRSRPNRCVAGQAETRDCGAATGGFDPDCPKCK